MAESSNEKLFRTKVLPIMDKVMADLRHKQLEEIGRHTDIPAACPLSWQEQPVPMEACQPKLQALMPFAIRGSGTPSIRRTTSIW